MCECCLRGVDVCELGDGLVGDLAVAMFVHLAPESRVRLIERSGIRRLRKSFRDSSVPAGIFAVPVVRNFYISHQWLRELKRANAGSIIGVYFRIPDDELVWIGHYSQHHQEMTAAECVAIFDSAEDRQGWEVIIPRSIRKSELHRTRVLPQVIGWRYYPSAKGSRPRCTCDYCIRGEVNANKLRKRYLDKDDN